MRQRLWGSNSMQAVEAGESKPYLPHMELEQLKGYRGLALLKLDCEFEVGDWDGRRLVVKNRYGRWRWDFPASGQLEEILEKMKVEQARLLMELYAVDGSGGVLPFNQAMSVIKSPTPQDEERMRLMVFAWPEVDHERLRPFSEQWRLIKKLPAYGSGALVHAPKFWMISSYADLRRAMDWVTSNEMEGLVLRGRYLDAKVKDESEVDAVVIGRKTGHTVRGRSYLVALMPREGTFVEIGHFGTGLTWTEERHLNGELEPLKLGEDPVHTWYRPEVIVKLRYRGILAPSGGEADNRVFRYNPAKGYEEVGLMNLGHLRMASLDRQNPFRTDKRVNPADLRMNQLKEYNRRSGEIRILPSTA